MEALILTNIEYFKYTGKDVFTFNNCQLINASSEAELMAQLADPAIAIDLGSVFLYSLLSPNYFYHRGLYSSLDELENSYILINNSLREFSNFLWFIKDNCVNINWTGTYSKDQIRSIVNSHISNSMANSDMKTLGFSTDEIISAVNIARTYNTIATTNITIDTNQFIKDSYLRSPINSIEYNTFNRIERAMSFMRKARGTRILPEKISFYVMVLECLFSGIKNVEIKFRISERVAYYIGKDYEEKQTINKQIRLYYDVRSSYVHGQGMDSNKFNTNEKLRFISIEIDNLVRNVLLKIILKDNEKFLAKDQELEKWFTDQMFT